MPRRTVTAAIPALAALVFIGACTGSYGTKAELLRCKKGLCFSLHGAKTTFVSLTLTHLDYSCARHGQNRYGLLLMHDYRREVPLLAPFSPLSGRAMLFFHVVDRKLNPFLGQLLTLHRNKRGYRNSKVFPTPEGFLVVFTTLEGIHYIDLHLGRKKVMRKTGFHRFESQGKLSIGFTYRDGIIYARTVETPRNGGLTGVGRSRIVAVNKATGRLHTMLDAEGVLRGQAYSQDLRLRQTRDGLLALLTRATSSPYRKDEHLVYCPYGAAKCRKQRIPLASGVSGPLRLFRRKGGIYVLAARSHKENLQAVWQLRADLRGRLEGTPQRVLVLGGKSYLYLSQTKAGYRIRYRGKDRNYRYFDSETGHVTLSNKEKRGSTSAWSGPAPGHTDCKRILSSIH